MTQFHGWNRERVGLRLPVGVVRCISAGCLLLLHAAAGADAKKGEPADTESQSQELQVTSDTLDMDFAGRAAVFEGNVRVSDAKMVLTAEKMNVLLTEEDELKSIEAIGNVVVVETDSKQRALAGRAFYDVLAGTITLLENPVLEDGEVSKTRGSEIIYYRDTEKFKIKDPVINWRSSGKDKGGLPSFLRPAPKSDKVRKDDGIDESAGEG